MELVNDQQNTAVLVDGCKDFTVGQGLVLQQERATKKVTGKSLQGCPGAWLWLSPKGQMGGPDVR